MAPKKQPIHERFWARVDRSAGPDACWPWTLGRQAAGYGKCKRDGRTVLAHRLAYELVHGAVPAGLIVRHRCDNPPCCNPAHLESGTPKDNTRDMDSRGRRVGNVKLSQADVAVIRREYRPGTNSYKQLARRFGVSWGHICKIAKAAA